MKNMMIVLMMTLSMGLMAEQTTDAEKLTFEFDQKTFSIELTELLVFPDPPNSPRCYGFAPLCNLAISMLAAGRPDIPSGCHYSGHPSSNVYFCQIE